MSLMQAYFNLVYNPVYDFTTGQLSRYSRLQNLAVSRLDLKDGERMLCLGVGTGNEIRPILRANKNIDVTGIDYSRTALEKTHKKARRIGKEISLFLMDARKLGFDDCCFDKAFCFHVLDFIADGWDVTDEILRVLKPGGQFVVTYPYRSEGMSMGFGLMKEVVQDHLKSGKNRFAAALEMSVHLICNTVYLPLLLRRQKRTYSSSEIENGFECRDCKNIQVETDDVYQDYIVSGVK